MRQIFIVGTLLAALIVIGIFLLPRAPRVPITPVGSSGERFHEITNPSGFVNSDGITLASLVGTKVILVDFMTYSCINCQRTFPYLVAWDAKYRDQGLAIIGIHTPEFAFEKNIENVRTAMQQFGIRYPVVLDNEYATWNAYGNRYWPRKYLIDVYGNIVYDHVGEGAYEETETKIRELLSERARVVGEERPFAAADPLAASAVQKLTNTAQSPETYFGSLRNEFLANGIPGASGTRKFSFPTEIRPHALYFDGTWNITPEYAESVAESRARFHYYAKEVYVVADANAFVKIQVLQDGAVVREEHGEDVGLDGVLTVEGSRLYRLILNQEPGEHVLEFRIQGAGLRLYALTFG